MRHDWYLDPETGEPDIFRLDAGYCNGPECRRCKIVFCHHCNPHCWNDECPSGQQEMFS